MKIGEMLIAQNVIDRNQLRNALIQQIKTGKKLGVILVEMGYCNWEQIARGLSKQLDLPYIDIEKKEIPPKYIYMVSLSLMNKYQFIPFDYRERLTKRPLLSVAISDPHNLLALDDLSLHTGCELKVYIAEENKIETILQEFEKLPSLHFKREYTLENVTRQLLTLNAFAVYLTPYKPLTILHGKYSEPSVSDRNKNAAMKWPIIQPEDIKIMAHQCFVVQDTSLFSKEGRMTTNYELPGLANFRVDLHNQLFCRQFDTVRLDYRNIEITITRLGPGSQSLDI